MWILHWYLVALMKYIFMWIFKVGKFEYIDIWQVLKKKKKGKLLKIYVCESIYVENMTVGRMWIYICWKYNRWQDAKTIENVTIEIVVEFEKKKRKKDG